MRDQPPLALPPPAGSAHWNRPAPLGERLTQDLAECNANFLALAIDLHALRPGMPPFGLPAHLLPALARLGRPGLAGLRLSVALFDLRFRDAAYWRAQVAASSAVHDGEVARMAEARPARFARSAVTFAWHLAQIDSRVARLVLGLETATRELLAGLPVARLEPLACRVAPVLTARFCTRERFWTMLAEAARPGTPAVCAERVRLLGMQLQGADAARAQQLYRRARRSTQA